MINDTDTRDVLLTVHTSLSTGACVGSIKLNEQAMGLPTGGGTLAETMGHAFRLAAAFFKVTQEMITLTVAVAGGQPFAVRGDGVQAPDLGILTSGPSRRTLSQTRWWGSRTNRTWVDPLLKIIRRGVDLVFLG